MQSVGFDDGVSHGIDTRLALGRSPHGASPALLRPLPVAVLQEELTPIVHYAAVSPRRNNILDCKQTVQNCINTKEG